MNGSKFSVYIYLIVLLLFCFSLNSNNAQAECTPSDDCTVCQTKGEKLKCKFDTLMEEGGKTIDHLQGPAFSDLLPPAQMASLEKSKENLNHGRNRLKAADFHLMAKKKDTTCQLVEIDGDYIGDDDGVCDSKTEDCVEVLGDGIGDDDGICSPLKGKKREVCVEICDEEATLQDEGNVDTELSAELEGVYDSLIEHTRELNEELPQAATLILAYKPLSDPTEICPLNAEGLSRTNSTLKDLARGAATGARGCADISERLCDQQIAGFNCAACCAPAEVIAGALVAAWTAIEIVEATINSATIDAALKCVAAMKQAAGDNNAKLTGIMSNLNQIQKDQERIIKLLKTPLGRREDSR
jgi:hypothetical protein